MENDRQAQLDPLPDPPDGVATFSQNQLPGSRDKSRSEGQSGPQFNQAHAALLPPDDSSADNGRLEAQPKRPRKANNSFLHGTVVRDLDTDSNSGMLESQLGSRLNTMTDIPQETENRTLSPRCNQPKSAFQNTLENFTSTWFVIPMNTGILAIIMHQLPYQFNGLPVLCTIMYLVALTLFVIISFLTILRWTLYAKAAQPKTAASVDEMSFLATAPITFLTLTSLTGLIVSNAYWGGYAWSLVAYTIWWIGMFWTLTTGGNSDTPCVLLR